MFLARNFIATLFAVIFCAGPWLSAAEVPLTLRSNDVVAFVGGSDVAATQFSGHLETLLVLRFPGARFRNFGWEGDTVFAQPRDVGFPPLAEHFRRAGITVLFIEFGRAEALSSKESVPAFSAACEKLVSDWGRVVPRVVLITPPPFESGGDLLPDLSPRNKELAARANAIRALAQGRKLLLIDLFSELGGAGHVEPRLTDNGLQLTPRGHALTAMAFMRQLGVGESMPLTEDMNGLGVWSNARLETLRQLVVEKNRLWFNYWRPQNWAFLGGDRTSQPSSRDHRNPNVRWFPAEMEKYVPLIRAKEQEIEQAAAMLRGGAR